MFDSFAVAIEPRFAVEAIHRQIQEPVGHPEVGGHAVGVIKVGQVRAWIGGTGVQHSPCQVIQLRLVGVSQGRPGNGL